MRLTQWGGGGGISRIHNESTYTVQNYNSAQWGIQVGKDYGGAQWGHKLGYIKIITVNFMGLRRCGETLRGHSEATQ